MADGDQDFITPLGLKNSHISVQPQSTPAFCGPPPMLVQVNT